MLAVAAGIRWQCDMYIDIPIHILCAYVLRTFYVRIQLVAKPAGSGTVLEYMHVAVCSIAPTPCSSVLYSTDSAVPTQEKNVVPTQEIS